MTRQFSARRIAQPVAVVRRPLPEGVNSSSFAVFRLVMTTDGWMPAQLAYSRGRMSVFVTDGYMLSD